MNVLVTGANGLLGHHVVIQLLNNKHDVKIIVRNKRNIHFDLQQVTTVEGNFTDYETLKLAARNCDAIIHIAAVTSTHLLHYSDYKKVNIDGSATVIRVANELYIKTLVFISTANTIGFGTKAQLADETCDFQFPFTNSYYAQSKTEAEALFKTASLLPHRHVIIINPTFLIGAYDIKPSSGKLMLMGYRKRLMTVPMGGKNFVDVRHAAVAICNALTQGKNGERYLISGVNCSFYDFYTVQKTIGNYHQFVIQIPDFLLIAIGRIGDLIRKFGVETDVCTMNLRQLLIQEHYSNAKARAELSLPETDLKTAIAQAVNWFKTVGMIK